MRSVSLVQVGGVVSATLLAMLIGCATEDGAGRPIDASAPLACEATEPLEIGRCVNGAAVACLGDETRATFAALADEPMMVPVTGPQGATMFAFALRATGIVPGDPDEPLASSNPVIELLLVDDASVEVARYRGRSGMREVADLPGVFEAAQLYLVIDEPLASLFGNAYVLHATLTDAGGAVRCGELRFEAGR